MGMNVDFSGIKGEGDLGGDWKVKPGRYHCITIGADDSCDRSDSVLTEYLVVAGTAPGQEGKRIRDWLPLSEKAQAKLHRAILALGLMKPGKKGAVDFSKARGCELIVEIVEEEYEGKLRSKPSFTGYWRLSHPEVNDVPRGKVPDSEELPQPWWEGEEERSDDDDFDF